MLTPRDEADLAEAIRVAKDPLAIQGGGTRGVPVTGALLSTAAIAGITTYEPGALTLVVKAGTPLAEIETVLDAENQMLAFEPMDHRPLMGSKAEPSIGGVVAVNVSGPRRVQTGACRDYLLGVRFVDGSGEVIKNGGRVMKNVTGYDLARMQCGAHGTLGVLTEVSFKVLPRPKVAATLMVYNLGTSDAVTVMAKALGSPFEVTGAAASTDDGVVFLRLEGSETQVTYRLEQLEKRIAPLLPSGADFGKAPITDIDRVTRQWVSIRDQDEYPETNYDVWRVAVKPSDAPGVCDALGPDIPTFLDWGGGLVWVYADPGQDIRPLLVGIPGHATRIKGKGDIPRLQPENAGLAKLAAGLRQKFDPKGILNPGLMG